MHLVVAPDRRHARLDLPPDASAASVRALLDAEGIVVGVDHAAIDEGLRRAQAVGQTVPGVLVAQSPPPKPGTGVKVRYRLPPGATQLPPLTDLVHLLGAANIRQIEEAGATVRGWLVRPGQLLGQLKVEGGRPGEDLWGRPVPPPPPARAVHHGDGVEVRADGVYATRLGYAGAQEARVTVLPPIWVDPSGDAAWFVRLPPLGEGPQLTVGDLSEALLAAAVVRGADTAAMRRCVQGAAGIVHCIARAIPPENPPAPTPRFTFDHALHVGTEREDGTTDFKERNMFPAVEAGALLAECPEPGPGRDGVTVTGQPIPARAPPKLEIIGLDHVRHELVDGVHRLYAEIGGTATVQSDVRRSSRGERYRWKLAVRSALKINGDVDYATGHIDAQGNVAVKGKVTRGFRVTATGDVRIGGELEDGAIVEAGGDVQVGLGIIGAETVVEAGGTIRARFVHEAHLEAGGDVLVQRYIHDAQVKAGGWVKVAGRGGRGVGGITGGRIVARRGVESRTLGSAYAGGTLVEIGVDDHLTARIADTRDRFEQADDALRAVAARLGLTTFDEPSVRGLITEDPVQRRALLAAVREARPTLHRQVLAREQLDALNRELESLVHDARVLVEEITHPGVTVWVGKHRCDVVDPIEKARFQFDPNAHPPRVVWRDPGTAHASAHRGSSRRRRSLI